MEFNEVVVNRRSVRKFRLDAVPKEALNRILEAGRWAPSASNSQPWRFIVVKNADVKERISRTCTRFSRKMWAAFATGDAKYLAQRGGTWDKAYMKNIPVLMAVCYEVPEKMRNEVALASVWVAIENLLLAATAEKLGSCIYTFYDSEEENELKRILKIPEPYRIATIIQLGYADTSPPPPSRKELDKIVSYDRF